MTVHEKGGDFESSGRGAGGDSQARGVPKSSTLSLMEDLGSLKPLGKPCALGDRVTEREARVRGTPLAVGAGCLGGIGSVGLKSWPAPGGRRPG